MAVSQAGKGPGLTGFSAGKVKQSTPSTPSTPSTTSSSISGSNTSSGSIPRGGSSNLSPATIAAQQALSNQYGITTYNLSGGVSTTPSSSSSGSITSTVLGPATIAAQQALSEQFGVPTFDLSGLLSTIPQTRPLSNINVGQGAYNVTNEEFMTFLKTITPQQVIPIIIPPVPVNPNREATENELSFTPQNDLTNIPKQVSSIVSSTIDKYGIYLILAVIIYGGISLVKF